MFPMTFLVATKRVIDANVKPQVKSDGTGRRCAAFPGAADPPQFAGSRWRISGPYVLDGDAFGSDRERHEVLADQERAVMNGADA
jgi:hypothetical protein